MNGQKKSTKGGVWFKHRSKKINKYYYYNALTSESFWEKPEGVEVIDMTEQIPLDEKDTAKDLEEDVDDYELYQLVCSSKPLFQPTPEESKTKEIRLEDEEALARIKSKLDLAKTEIYAKGIKHQQNGAHKHTDPREKTYQGGSLNEITQQHPTPSGASSTYTLRKIVPGDMSCPPKRLRTDPPPSRTSSTYTPRSNVPGDMSCPPKRMRTELSTSTSGPSTSETRQFLTKLSSSTSAPSSSETRQLTKLSTSTSAPSSSETRQLTMLSTSTSGPSTSETRQFPTNTTKEDLPLIEFLQQYIDNTIQDKLNIKGQELPRKHKQRKPISKQEQIYTKVSKTPTMQERHLMQKAELLKKQQLKNPVDKQELPKVDKNNSKTPIQDRYHKLKEELRNKANLKNDLEKEPELLKRPPVHERLGWSPNINRGVELKEHHSPEESALISNFDNSILNTGKRQFVTTGQDLRTKLYQRQQTSRLQEGTEMEWEDSVQTGLLQSQDNNFDRLKENTVSSITAAIKDVPGYKLIYLVFDTSAILDNVLFVVKTMTTGTFADLPIKLIIPFALLRELDGVKLHMDMAGKQARELNRIFASVKQNKNVCIQEGSKSNEAVGNFVFTNNDESILNCCLQTRKICGEDEITILITSDNNQASKARSFDLETYDLPGFKKWARKYSEELRCKSLELKKKTDIPHTFVAPVTNNVTTNESMDVDTVPAPEPLNCPQNPRLSNERLSMNGNTEVCTTADLKNCIRSHVDELKIEFQAFLHDILDEVLTKTCGVQNNQKTIIKPSWTLIEYIIEYRKRWFTIMSSVLSPSVNILLSKFVAALKRYNADKEVLMAEDVDMIFSLCSEIADMFSRKYKQQTSNFMKKLYDLKDYWKEEYDKVSSSSTGIYEELVQPVDLALQNIHSCLSLDYDYCKTQLDTAGIEHGSDDSAILYSLFEKIATLTETLKSALMEDPAFLLCTTKKICDVHKMVTNFSNGRGTSFGFDLTIENVVELFKDKDYRENLKQMIVKYEQLKKNVDNIIDLVT